MGAPLIRTSIRTSLSGTLACQRRIEESGKNGKRQGTKRGRRRRMSLLVAIRALISELGLGNYSSRMREWDKVEGRTRLQLEVTLDKFAEFLAVFIAHVDEFDAAAVGADVADHGSESDLAETGADLDVDGVAERESSRGFQISAAKADCFYARKARGCALDLRA